MRYGWQVLGLFVRKVHLAFRSTTFEELCALVTHFGLWVREAAAVPAGVPAVGARPYLLPASQLDSCMHELARTMEEQAPPFGSAEVDAKVEEMLDLAPHVPQVHYLTLLCHLHSRSHEEALESFHRYFDLVRAASAPSAASGMANPPVREATRAPTQWASLNLARLQVRSPGQSRSGDGGGGGGGGGGGIVR